MQLDLIDVFGSKVMMGNPLGVVRGGDAMRDEDMLALTQWLGFSETTFLLPPDNPEADYRLRIFYPAGELPFAGHPTLGSCHAWLAAGGRPKKEGVIVQQCGVGLIEIREQDEILSFEAPALTKSGALSDEEREFAIRMAGVDPAAVVEAVHVANGPKWQLLRLKSVDDVLAARPAATAPIGTDIGLAAPYRDGGEIAWELRAFFADQHGALREDPVTGSFNASVAVHLFDQALASEDYIAGQGQCVGADGHVHCSRDSEGRVWIGGKCATIAQGGEIGSLG